ncbi:MAG: S8 family serine peptidase [Thermoanaerobaculales bacterium]|jgi:subtilisin family serine protease|nr:S8 family serine peptidase [Thermoanaerobaculales bacterium]
MTHNTTLRSILFGAAVGAALLVTLPARADGTVDPDLRAVLERLGPGDRASVIVRFAGRAQPKRLAGATRAERRAAVERDLRARLERRRAAVAPILEDPSVARLTELWTINGIALSADAGVIRELAESPEVASITLDRVIDAPVPVKGQTAAAEWNLDSIRAPELWAAGHTGVGVVIGSMDTGVDETHPDLAPAYRGGGNSWLDPYGEHPDPHDRSGHGTQTMGVMVGGSAGGSAIGVAPGAQWIAAKIFNDAGQASLSAIHEGFQWMLDPDDDPDTDDGASVVNNSWSLQNIGDCDLEFEQDLEILRAAGVAVVFSGGNYGASAGTSVSPANNPSGFGVGFVDDRDKVHISSGRGPSACGGGLYPKVVAPGVNVRTADLGAYWAWVSGASIAAPHVSGAMALLRSAHPEATVEMLERALQASAVDLGAVGADSTYGSGRIDLVLAEQILGDLRTGGVGASTVYTDEGTFLAAIAGQTVVAEGFEDDLVWGGTRSPDSLAVVASQGIDWSSNLPGNELSTSGGAARTGSWGLYSNPHGNQGVPSPTDFIEDGVIGSSGQPLVAVGAWVRGTFGGDVVAILDGDEANPIGLGPVVAAHQFYGVVTDGAFSTFEFREIEGTFEDQRYIFLDDVTVALSTGGGAPVMDGVVAGVANLPGALGSDWHTDLFLHNSSTSPISAELYFSAEGETAGDLGLVAEIAPAQTLTLADVVATVFGVQGSGAIFWRVVDGDPAGLVASANTFNRVNAVKRYGQQIAGMRWTDAAPAGTLVLTPAIAGRYRTNLGFATDGDCSVVVVRAYDRSSSLVGQQAYNVQPWSWLQLNSLFRRVFPDLIDDPDAVSEAESLHRFEVVGVDGRVAAYTSIIDNATSDGSYMVGQVPLADGVQWLPGAAVVEGANASNWRSDVVAISTSGITGSADVAYYPAGQDNSGRPVSWNVQLDVGESLFVGNILAELFGYSPPAVGSLAVSSAQSPPLLWMRTYTEEPTVGGDLVTYGQAVLPRATVATIAAGSAGTVSGFSTDASTRANLILQNTRVAADGTRLASEVRVELLEAAGTVLHERTYSLLPGEYLQHNRFVEDAGVGSVLGASLRVNVLSEPGPGETGGVDAMVSEVNGNIVAGSNDSRLVRACVME